MSTAVSRTLVTTILAFIATLLLPGCATAAGDPLAAWHDALANADTDQANIVYVGSSTTYGAGASSLDRRYVNLVTDQLRGTTEPVVRVAATYPGRSTAPGAHGYTSAMGGTNSETYLGDSSRPWILWERPSLVVHMIGSNDSIDAEPYAVPVDEYEANVARQIDRLDEVSTRPMSHLLVHTFRRDGVSVAKWATYREALDNIAAERDNVAVLDISAEYEARDHLGADPDGLMSDDGTHPSDAGHALMAGLIADYLLPAEVVPEPTPTPEPEPSTTPEPTPAPAPTAAPEVTPALEPAPAAQATETPAPAATPAPAPTAPALSAPAAPRKVKAVRDGRTRVTWRAAAGAEEYAVRCGRTSAKVERTSAVVRTSASSCKVRAISQGGASPWVKTRVRR